MFLLDTNILIYHINKNMPESAHTKIKEIFESHFNISVISKIEFLGFKKHTKESFLKANKFLDYANIVTLDDKIVARVIALKREKSIKLPDAVIAATAMEYNWTLVTRNEKDFTGIDVKIYNPFNSK